MIRLVRTATPTIGEAIQHASIGDAARRAVEHRIREAFWSGVWWGGFIAGIAGIWGGWLFRWYVHGGTP